MQIVKTLDLSHDIFSNCPGYMPYVMASVKYEKIHPKDGYTAERIDCNSHTATHLDAPYHVFNNGISIDQMPVDLFMGEAVPINLGNMPARGAIGVEHLKAYEDIIKKGDIVLLCTGFAQKRGWNSDYVDNWPYLTEEGAKWLLDKGIKGIGTDALSISGNRPGEGSGTHGILLGANIWILEEMNFNDELFEFEKWFVISLPLKLQGFGGSPTRTVAVQFG